MDINPDAIDNRRPFPVIFSTPLSLPTWTLSRQISVAVTPHLRSAGPSSREYDCAQLPEGLQSFHLALICNPLESPLSFLLSFPGVGRPHVLPHGGVYCLGSFWC